MFSDSLTFVKKSWSVASIILLSFSYVFALIYLLIFGVYQKYYLIGWCLAIGTYLILLQLMMRRRSKIFSEQPIVVISISILLLSLIFRSIFLFRTELMTIDPYAYLSAMEYMLQGKIPYGSFTPPSPYGPVFMYFITAIGAIFTPQLLPMRFFFILCDSITSCLIFQTGRRIFDVEKSAFAALAYSLNPLSIIEVGWSGHNDALASMFLILAIFLYLSNRKYSSAVAFAFSAGVKWSLSLPLFILLFKDKESKISGKLAVFSMFAFTTIAFSAPFLILCPREFIHDTFIFPMRELWLAFSFAAAARKVFPGSEQAVILILNAVVLLSVIDLDVKRKNSAFRWHIILSSFYIANSLITFFYRSIFSILALPSLSLAVLMFVKVFRERFKGKDLDISWFEIIGIPLLLLVFTVRAWHAWYYLWVLPLIMLWKRSDYRFLILLLIFLHQPMCYPTPAYFPGGYEP